MDRVEPQELYEALAHGSDIHRQWLRDAIFAFFEDKPVPPPYPEIEDKQQ